eukprot:CCRYP_004180-RB/>CCRYP_004180-RB protein AED:0.02 eAED:0.02 QI:69/-1/1/1/-1/0/1/304/586
MASNNPPTNPPTNDWRSTVSQAYRSTEVRSIAATLASLEPGATTASKTMLAMRFEESIFKAASSLDDYKKCIQKRLKKLQKHYSKTGATPGGSGAADGTITREKERLLENELREKFGSKLIYIAEKSDLAVLVLKQTSDNPQQADALLSHALKTKEWAGYLGIPLPNDNNDDSNNVDAEKKHRPPLDMGHLLKIKAQMEKFVDVIRSHISKICDPEIFLLDKLMFLEQDFMKRSSCSDIVQRAFAEHDRECPHFTVEEMQRLLDKLRSPLPAPRRNQEEGADVRASVARIDRIRTVAQAMYIYVGLSQGDKTAFPNGLQKTFDIGRTYLNELEKEYDSLLKGMEDTDENGQRILHLEDAWNNVLRYEGGESEGASSLEDMDAEPEAKRQKVETRRYPMVICSRVLLTPGRCVISSIVPVLKRKRATLIRNKTASYVRLEFGNAFEMNIYFVPLLVTVRAMERPKEGQLPNMVTMAGELTWPSLHQGLRPSLGSDGTSNDDGKDNKDLTVLGVTGPYSTLGHIITKKLQYASAQATHVLRRCFAETTIGKGALAKSDFEVEILEIGALVKFLQIARSTYIPDWVDDD